MSDSPSSTILLPEPLATPLETTNAVPPRVRKSGQLRRWGARAVVLAMTAGAVYGGVLVTEHRTAADSLLPLDKVTLTAQAVPVEPLRDGIVTTLAVSAGEQVTTGESLGSYVTTSTNAAGKTVHQTLTLRAPVAGVVVGDPAPIGSTVHAGQAFVSVYDPSQLTLVADVPLDQLSEFSVGMKATLHADGLSKPVSATIVRSVPRIGNDPTIAPGQVHVVLEPSDPKLTSQLLPGLVFSGTVNPDTASKKAKDGIFVGN
jgi:hypothetical protein